MPPTEKNDILSSKRDATIVVGMQPKLSLKDVAKKPIKDPSKPKAEDTELIKLIKKNQPRGPKKPYELASGAVTPTASPIDAAVLAASGMPQLIGRGLSQALPYLDAPLTVGSKVFPSVTANNVLNAAGAAYSGEQIINPKSDLRTNPNAENILMTGLGLVGLPYKSAGLSFIDDLGQAGKYLTEETALKNAYKYNPWAFKPNPEAYYRGIGKSGLDDAIKSKIIRPHTKGTYDKLYFTDDIKHTNTYAADSPKYKGDPFDQTGNDAWELIPGDYKKYIAEIPKKDIPLAKSVTKGTRNGLPAEGPYYTSEKFPSTNNVKFYKEHWLKGYKEITKPKSNFKSEIDWAKWNKEIPENKALMQEYNAIEETSKANGTWMKNSDGSKFEGTPEQFVQQNSQNFKKAFGNSVVQDDLGNPIIMYHGSPQENIQELLPPKYNQNWTEGRTATDKNTTYNFLTPKKSIAEKYSRKDMMGYHTGDNLSVYVNSKNPLYTNDYIELANPDRYINNHNDYDIITNLQFGKDFNAKDFSEIAIPFKNKVKSAIGNNGMFDMTNPNIYKSLFPYIGLGGAGILGAEGLQKNNQEHKYGGNMKLNKYNYGGYMYGNGGNTLYVNDPNHPRLKAYQDSLNIYNLSQQAEKLFKKDVNNPDIYNIMDKIKTKSNPVKVITPSGEFNWSKSWDENQRRLMEEPYLVSFAKPVQPVKYQKLDKIKTTDKLIDNTYNNFIDLITRPTEKVNTPKIFTDEYTSNYNNPNINKGRIKYGKGKTEEFAYGGYMNKHLYTNGGTASVLNQSNITTGEVEAEENTLLDKNKKTVDTKPTVSNNKADKTMKTANVSSPVNLNIPSFQNKPTSSTTSNYNAPNSIIGGTGALQKSLDTFSPPTSNIQAPTSSDILPTMDMSTAPPPTTNLDQLGQGIELNANTSLSSTAQKVPKGSKISAGQVIGAVQGGINSYNAINAAARLNQGNTTGIPKSQQIDANVNAVDTTVNSALNMMGPVGQAVSAVRGVGDMIGKPIKEKAEARNPDGTLQDPERAKTSAIIGSFFDPIKAITTRASYEGGWTDFTGDKYIQAIEGKKKINYTDPDVVNRNLKVAPESNMAKYGGKMYSWGGNIYANGGPITFSSGGEKHKVYIKKSPNGLGKGVEGHVMVNHPTMDKGKWDTIDLTEKAGAKTVAQGVAATKKWHRENPSYAMGGPINTMYAGGGSMYNMPTKGLTHEQHPWGGYPIGGNNYVEGGEVILDKPDGGKYIFSNRLIYK
jgi:hypothetical protein